MLNFGLFASHIPYLIIGVMYLMYMGISMFSQRTSRQEVKPELVSDKVIDYESESQNSLSTADFLESLALLQTQTQFSADDLISDIHQTGQWVHKPDLQPSLLHIPAAPLIDFDILISCSSRPPPALSLI